MPSGWRCQREDFFRRLSRRTVTAMSSPSGVWMVWWYSGMSGGQVVGVVQQGFVGFDVAPQIEFAVGLYRMLFLCAIREYRIKFLRV